MAKFCLVSQEHLQKTPEGFQEYVKKYFEETTVLSQKCFYAFRISDGYYFSIFNPHLKLKNTKGVAPTIIRERKDQFIADIPGSLTLDEWIEAESQKPANIRLLDQNNKYWSESVIDVD